MAEGRWLMVDATVEKLELYGCAGKSRLARAAEGA
jgi:hypothetical protein